jgi:hypothetical protein
MIKAMAANWKKLDHEVDPLLGRTQKGDRDHLHCTCWLA